MSITPNELMTLIQMTSQIEKDDLSSFADMSSSDDDLNAALLELQQNAKKEKAKKLAELIFKLNSRLEDEIASRVERIRKLRKEEAAELKNLHLTNKARQLLVAGVDVGIVSKCFYAFSRADDIETFEKVNQLYDQAVKTGSIKATQKMAKKAS